MSGWRVSNTGGTKEHSKETELATEKLELQRGSGERMGRGEKNYSKHPPLFLPITTALL